jgi:hypothetical protein
VLAQAIAWLTPLAHSVALARQLAIGSASAFPLAHLAVPLVYAVAGIVAAAITFRRRLTL